MKQRILQSPVIVLIDSLAITAALYLSLLARFMGDIPGQFMHYYFDLLGPAVLVHIMLFAIFGLYKIASINFKYLFRIAVTIFLSVVASYLLSTTYAPLPRSSFIIAALLVFGYVLLTRYLAYRLILKFTDDDKLLQHQERRSVDHLIMSTLKSLIKTPSKVLDYFAKNTELTLLLFFSFIIRFFIADKNSYWLDEHYSVVRYGIDHLNVFDMIKDLANTSVHPPLYQFTLFYWMKVFGHSEVATRSLSILYIVLAILFIYLMCHKLFNKRVAFMSALFFSLTYTALYYSIESRSYAQSLFLVTLSTYLLILLINFIGSDFNWQKVFSNKYYVLLVIVNISIMLTHYYNWFFISAQGLFVFLYFVHIRGKQNVYSVLAKTLIIYLVQVFFFLIIWGKYVYSTVNRFSDSVYVSSSPTLHPIEMFMRFLVGPNLDLPVLWALFVLAMIAVYTIDFYYKNEVVCRYELTRPIYLLYFAIWAIVPFIFAYFAVYIVQLERYSARYFVYCLPAFVVMLAISFDFLFTKLDRIIYLFKNKMNLSIDKFYKKNYVLIALFLTLMVVFPGAIKATERAKADWRGIANQIVQVVEHDNSNSYIIFETSFRNYPTLNYYFSNFSDTVRVNYNLRRSEEKRGSDYIFEKVYDEISDYDYLVVVFTHHTVDHFPIALKLLNEQYNYHYQIINQSGRGFIVFQVQ